MPIRKKLVSGSAEKVAQARAGKICESALPAMRVGEGRTQTEPERSPVQELKEFLEEFLRQELLKLRKELRKELADDITKVVAEAVAPFKKDLEQMDKRLDTQESQVGEIQKTISDCGDRVVALEATVELLGGLCKTLRAKAEDQENTSRRQNLRIVGLPEGTEGASPTKYVSRMLEDLVKKGVLDKPPEVDRAHRSPRWKPRAGEPPRAVIIRLHSFLEKEKILRWAKESRSCEWEGHKVRIYQDIGAELAKRRAGFNRVKTVLYQRQIKFGMLYPARLWVTFNGLEYYFETPEAAEDFIKEYKLRED